MVSTFLRYNSLFRLFSIIYLIVTFNLLTASDSSASESLFSSPLLKQEGEEDKGIPKDEYAVISAALDSLPRYNFYTENDPGLLVRDITTHQINQKFTLPVDIYPELKSQTWYDWLKKFSDKHQLDKKLKTRRIHQLTNDDFESRLTITDPTYKQMTKLGYDQIVSVTRPGFDKHKTQAVVYLFSKDFSCEGVKVILVKNFGSYWDVDKNTINKKPDC